MDFDSADGFLASNDLIYLMSIVVTLLLALFAAGMFCYCKRLSQLTGLLKSAQESVVQIESVVNSARNSRNVEGCQARLVSFSTGSSGAAGWGAAEAVSASTDHSTVTTTTSDNLGIKKQVKRDLFR